MRHHVGVRLDPLDEAEALQPLDDALARGEAVDLVKLLGELPGAFRQVAQIVLVVDEIETTFPVDHADAGEAVAIADLEIVEVVRRRDLDRARALLRIGIIVGDDFDLAADQRQDHVVADQLLIALILGMHGDAGIAEHGLGARGGDDDEARGILGAERPALDRIAQIPEVTLDLGLLHLEIRDRGEQLGVPVHQPLVLVDQPFAVQLDENLDDGLRQALVHGEAFARPVAGRAEALELVDDGVAALGLPLPDPLEKFGAAHLAAAGLLTLHQLPLDHHLGGDAGMVGAGLPQHVAAAHALEPAQDVLERVVEGVAHVQRARHVRRRDHDGKGHGVAAVGTAGLEGKAVLPHHGHAGFDIGGLVIFLDHGAARKPREGAKSTKRSAQTGFPVRSMGLM